MPLPLLLTSLTAVGLKKAYDNYQDNKSAELIEMTADNTYRIAKVRLQMAQQETEEALKELRMFYLKVEVYLHEFRTLSEQLIDKLEQANRQKIRVTLSTEYSVKLANLSMNSIAFRMITSVLFLGYIFAPITTLIPSYVFNATDVVEKAYEKQRKADEYDRKVTQIEGNLAEVNDYVHKVLNCLQPIYKSFQSYIDDLKIVDKMVRQGQQNLLEGQDNILCMVENGYALAAILVDIMTTPLFKIKNANLSSLDSSSEPEFETDENGLNILNRMEIKLALKQGQDKFRNIE